MGNNEEEKIREVVGKYSDYFKERDADVAMGIHGPHLFYFYDGRYRDFEIFRAFHTARELEMLILDMRRSCHFYRQVYYIRYFLLHISIKQIRDKNYLHRKS